MTQTGTDWLMPHISLDDICMTRMNRINLIAFDTHTLSQYSCENI